MEVTRSGAYRPRLLCGFGEGFESDFVAQTLQLLDGFALGSGGLVLCVVFGAGIAVESTVDQHVPGIGEHFVFDADQGDQGGQRVASGFVAALLNRSSAGDASVADAVEVFLLRAADRAATPRAALR